MRSLYLYFYYKTREDFKKFLSKIDKKVRFSFDEYAIITLLIETYLIILKVYDMMTTLICLAVFFGPIILCKIFGLKENPLHRQRQNQKFSETKSSPVNNRTRRTSSHTLDMMILNEQINSRYDYNQCKNECNYEEKKYSE